MATWRRLLFSPSSIVVAYLAAIVLANLLVAWFGPWVSVVNAFVFVGLTITARDSLHDAWHGRNLHRNMALLILAGAALSYMLGAGRIAIASAAAFTASETIDTITYALLRERAHLVRVNGSNVASAAVDSLLFPALAFGLPLMWPIVIGQFAAKVFGGAVWSVALRRGL